VVAVHGGLPAGSDADLDQLPFTHGYDVSSLEAVAQTMEMARPVMPANSWIALRLRARRARRRDRPADRVLLTVVASATINVWTPPKRWSGWAREDADRSRLVRDSHFPTPALTTSSGMPAGMLSHPTTIGREGRTE